MSITVLGAVLVPLSLLWAVNPVRLLQLALLAAVFEAAAALIFGGFGLQPAMVPGLLFLLYVILQYALGMRYPGEGQALRSLLPLVALMAYALLSIWLLPTAFAGQIMVWPQKIDPITPSYVPLAFSAGNITQTLYLLIDVAFTIAVAVFMSRAALRYERIIRAYLIGGYVVVALTFWQFANRVAGVPFPYEVLQSNPGWAIVEQAMGSVPRVQGPFSEPAALASYLAGLTFCCLWLCTRGYRTLRPDLLLALGMAAMMLSTSTTGIAILVAGLPMVVVFGTAGGDRRVIGRLARLFGMLILGGMLVLVPVLVMKPGLIASVQEVVDSTLTKQDSESYKDRSGLDEAALGTLSQTYGLGVGWGSFRASSLVPGLAANGGVFGLAMALLLLLRVSALIRGARRLCVDHGGQILMDGFAAAMCGQLAAALLSAPMISSLQFYLQLGCVVGVAARIRVDAHARRRSAARAPGAFAPTAYASAAAPSR
ncbi:MAG: hypothetical protein JSR21_01260 [Proteobacteria bacterium]|nr:hypothetical protein [Pseudomonadota bacterium]